MGCRSAHERKSSNERSRAYYQTDQGRDKKKDHNAKRSRRSDGDGEAQPESEPEARNGSISAAALSGEACSETRESVVLGEVSSFLRSYLQFLLRTIERRAITEEEVTQLLCWCTERLRQHRFDNRNILRKMRSREG